jgi:ATP-binding cassette subfamily B protein
MSYSNYQEKEYTKRFDLQVWRKVLRFAVPYKRQMIYLGLVLIAVAGLDTALPYMTMQAIDRFVVPQSLEGIEGFLLIYFLIVLVQAVNVWLFIAIAGKIDMGMCYDIRRKGFARLQELSFSYFDRTPVGWIMSRMTSDSERLSDTIAWGLVDMVWGLAMMLSISGIMLYLNWKLALLVLAVVPLLVWISGRFQVLILKSYREVRKTNSRITGAFNEGITGVKTTKTLVREEANLAEFRGLTGTMFQASFRAAVQSALYLPLVLVLGSIGAGLALSFGGNGVVGGTITYGLLVAFIAYTERFFEPVREVARIFAELQNAQASAERILTLLETEPEIIDRVEDVRLLPVPGFHDGILAGSTGGNGKQIRGQVEFLGVSFTYGNGRPVLSDLNLCVDAGETIALVGQTGGGKTTIVNLACRFYEPTAGVILIDGVDYTLRSQHWLQSNLGVVLQTPHLFSGTIRENIRYGRLEASDEAVEEAAWRVYAHKFIRNLPQVYDTQVGEGGGLLSTGQKQLISFARAILADPSIFIMDEATSSVDTETEMLVQKAIERILAGRTSFVIAHRLSTIRSADRILVIEGGGVVEMGNHEELIEMRGRYFDLHTRQFRTKRVVETLG